MRITWRRDQLVLNAGELATELRVRATDGPKESVYLLHEPPLSFCNRNGEGAPGISMG
ncbi:MAG TPA: hypothetical protein VF086_22410 [Propionibacteriaceae bacterium]